MAIDQGRWGKYNNVKKKKKKTSKQPIFKIVAFNSFSNILKRLNILKTKNTDNRIIL